MAEPNYATTSALDRLDARLTKHVEELEKKIEENGKSIVRVETLYQTLSELPGALNSLEKAMVGIDHNLKSMNERMARIDSSVNEQRHSLDEIRKKNQEQDKEIENVDNKSKIDWIDFITGNFWNILMKLVVSVAGLAVVYKVIAGT